MFALLLLPRALGGSFAGLLFAPWLQIGAVKDGPDRLFTRGVVGGNVEQLFGASWAFLPQLVDQGLASGPQDECTYHVGGVWNLVALPRKVAYVAAKGFLRLLPAVLEVPGISGAGVSALEVTYEDFS